jgi:hypothetical protein
MINLNKIQCRAHSGQRMVSTEPCNDEYLSEIDCWSSQQKMGWPNSVIQMRNAVLARQMISNTFVLATGR